jgi:hypothetical protein
MFRVQGYTIFALTVLGLIGVMSLLLATVRGIGIDPDSIVYVSAARSLLAGQGLTSLDASGTTRPMAHFAPLYPMLLAAVSVWGADPLEAARWLNAFLFGANILAVGFLISRSSGGSTWSPVAGSLLMLSSVSMLAVHANALTEPLFILLGFLGLFLLAGYLESSMPRFLIACSCAMSLAFLTRYAGIAFIITGAAGIILFSKRTCYRRMTDAITFCAISVTPLALWLIRNSRVGGTATNRTLVFHPIGFRHAKHVVSTFSKWLLPDRQVLSNFSERLLLDGLPASARPICFLVIGAALLVSCLLLLQTTRGINKRKSLIAYVARVAYLPRLLAVFIFVYVLFLTVSISFVDAQIEFDNRILAPVYISGVVIILCLAPFLLPSIRGSGLPLFLCVSICLTVLAFNVFQGTVWVLDGHSHGISMGGVGYGSKAWHRSETLTQLRSLPDTIPIFSNAPDGIYILTGRRALPIPKKRDPNTLRVNESYLSELAGMIDQLGKKGGVVAYFKTVRWRHWLPKEEELVENLPLEILFRGADGTIYGVDHGKN